MDSHVPTGPPRIVWLSPESVEMSCALLKLSTTPAPIKMSVTMIDSGSRMRTIERTRSTQKFPSSSLRYCEPPDQRDGDRHSHRATSERLNAETGHQTDVAEGRFARVILPPRVCRKRNSRIER